MHYRTVMIFPQFSNLDVLQRIREAYDPLAELVRPHITLVFSFLSPMSNEELLRLLEQELHMVRPFRIVLHGISRHSDASGHYLYLNVEHGADKLQRLHSIFYENVFREFDEGVEFVPHITLGKFRDAQAMEDAYDRLKELDETFQTTVYRISVEEIGDWGESILLYEIPLR